MSNNPLRVVVVGSSGKDGLLSLISGRDYRRMCSRLNSVLHYLRPERGSGAITLVSGGSALADHTAVSLFLNGECQSLELFLPDYFSTEQMSFTGIGPVKNLDNCHIRFSSACDINSLEDLSTAMSRRQCGVRSFSGVSPRNVALADSKPDFAVVFGFDRKEGILLHPNDRCKWSPSGSTGQMWRTLRKSGIKVLYLPIKSERA